MCPFAKDRFTFIDTLLNDSTQYQAGTKTGQALSGKDLNLKYKGCPPLPDLTPAAGFNMKYEVIIFYRIKSL